jgi:hypothetical protein
MGAIRVDAIAVPGSDPDLITSSATATASVIRVISYTPILFVQLIYLYTYFGIYFS